MKNQIQNIQPLHSHNKGREGHLQALPKIQIQFRHLKHQAQ